MTNYKGDIEKETRHRVLGLDCGYMVTEVHPDYVIVFYYNLASEVRAEWKVDRNTGEWQQTNGKRKKTLPQKIVNAVMLREDDQQDIDELSEETSQMIQKLANS